MNVIRARTKWPRRTYHDPSRCTYIMYIRIGNFSNAQKLCSSLMYGSRLHDYKFCLFQIMHVQDPHSNFNYCIVSIQRNVNKMYIWLSNSVSFLAALWNRCWNNVIILTSSLDQSWDNQKIGSLAVWVFFIYNRVINIIASDL